MDTEEQQLKEEQEQPKKRRKRRRIVGFALMGIAALLILAQLMLLYFADPLLRNAITKVVQRKSEGLYAIDFEDIKVNLTRRSFELSGFRLIPDTALYSEFKQQGKDDKALYDVSFDRLEFNGIHVFQLFSENNLSIENIILEQPHVAITGVPGQRKEERRYDAIHQDLYPILSKFAKSLRIGHIRVTDGYFNFYYNPTDTKGRTAANSINVALSGFYLDEEVYKTNTNIFYSQSIEISANNYQLRLNDSIHTVRVGQLWLSTAQSEIVAKNVSVQPLQYENEEAIPDSANIFRFSMPQISIIGFNFSEAYFNQLLSVEHFLLEAPELNIVYRKTKDKDKENNNSEIVSERKINLYQLIKGKLQSVFVDTFLLNNAQVRLYKNISDTSFYDIGSLSVTLNRFFVDSAEATQTSKILYSDEIELQMNNLSMQLADNVHLLSAEKLHISTEQSLLSATNVELKPASNATGYSQNYYHISVPQLDIRGAQFHEAYHKKEMKITDFILQQPRVTIRSYRDLDDKQEKRQVNFDLYQLTSSYLRSLYIRNIALNNGFFDLTNFQDGEKEAFSSGRLTLQMSDFLLDSELSITDKFFYANNINIEFNDYSLKLHNNVHLLNAGTVRLSTANSEILIENFTLEPTFEGDTIAALKAVNKNYLMDISVEKLHLYNADIHEAYFNNQLLIDSISIASPDIDFTLYEGITTDSLAADSGIINKIEVVPDSTNIALQLIKRLDSMITSAPDSMPLLLPTDSLGYDTLLAGNVYRTLNNYLDTIKITSFSLSNGKIKFTKNDSTGHRQIAFENELDIKLSNFFLDTDSVVNEHKLFSDDIDILLHEYQFNLPDRIHTLKAKEIGFSTAKAELFTNHLRLTANKTMADSLQQPVYFEFYTKGLQITGIQLDEAYRNRAVHFRTIDLQQPHFFVFNREAYKNEAKQTQDTTSNFTLKLPSVLSAIGVDTLLLTDGDYALIQQRDTLENIVSRGDFTFVLKNFRVDTTTLATPDGLPEGNFRLSLHNFELQLPDSLHFIQFQHLDISSQDSFIRAENIKINYREVLNYRQRLLEENKSTLLHLKLPRLKFTGVDFKTIFLNQIIDVDSVQIFEPLVDIESYPMLRRNRSQPPREVNLYHNIQPYLKAIAIEKFDFDHAHFEFSKHLPDTTTHIALSDLSVELKNLVIDSISYKDENKIYYTDDIIVRIRDYSAILPDSLYKIETKEIGVSLAQSRLWIDTLLLTPRFNPFEFDNKKGYQAASVRLWSNHIALERFDILRLIEKRELKIGHAGIDSMYIEIFKDTELPYDMVAKPLPQDILLNASLNIDIDTVELGDSYLLFQQHFPETRNLAYIEIENLKAEIFNASNDSLKRAENEKMRINTSMDLMGTGHIEADFTFPLNPVNGEYSFKGEMGRMTVAELNPYLEQAFPVKIKDGHVSSIRFNVNANNDFASGRIWAKYNSLKINIYETDSLGRITDKRGFLSAVANGLLKRNNPRFGSIPKPGIVYYERLPNRPVVQYWILSLVSGLKSTVGLNSKEMRQIRKDKRQGKRHQRRERRKHRRNNSENNGL